MALIYAANFTVAKQVMPEYLQPFGFIALRVSFAAVLFWLTWAALGRERPRREDWGRLVVCGLTGVAFNQLLFFKGLNLTTPIHGALIMLTTPILVLLLGSRYERLTRRKILGVALGLGGAAALVLSRSQAVTAYAPNPALGDLFIALNAASYAVYLILIKPLMARYHPVSLMAWTFGIGWLLVLPLGWSDLSNTDWASFQPQTWWAVFFVLFFVTYLTYLLNALAMRKVSAAVAGMYIYWQPVLTSLIAVTAGKDELNALVAGASLAIAAGVYLVNG